MCVTKFSALSKIVFSKRSKKQANKHTKWALLKHVVNSKSVKNDIKSIKTKCAIGHNGVWIGKLVEEVLPPQSVAGEEASSAWTG